MLEWALSDGFDPHCLEELHWVDGLCVELRAELVSRTFKVLSADYLSQQRETFINSHGQMGWMEQ